MADLKPIWHCVRELEAARREAEEEVLKRVYEEAFQRGVERGKLEQRMADAEAKRG